MAYKSISCLGFFVQTVDIVESGNMQQMFNCVGTTVTYKWYLMMCDVFEVITVGVGESLQWNYVFEVLYPQ